MVTNQTAAIMNLPDYGFAVGKKASLVVMDAGNLIEAIRLRPERRLVLAKGKFIARRERRGTKLTLYGRPLRVNRGHATHWPKKIGCDANWTTQLIVR